MSYKISDSVAMRMIQIFQEAVIFGIDGADLLRQVRLVPDSQDEGTLTLDPEYVKVVETMHEQYLAEAAKKQAEAECTAGVTFSEVMIILGGMRQTGASQDHRRTIDAEHTIRLVAEEPLAFQHASCLRPLLDHILDSHEVLYFFGIQSGREGQRTSSLHRSTWCQGEGHLCSNNRERY
jgi:hypothetical protein